jgi:uncharacterized protein (DUF924 family)
MYRGKPQAFASDSHALKIAKEGLIKGFDRRFSAPQRTFFYLPFEHSENLEDQEESVHLLNKVGINSQEASALIVVTQHYDTLQSLSEKVNSNLILLPNSPTTASDMLNTTITSFAASHQLGEQLKLNNPMPKLEEKVILKE